MDVKDAIRQAKEYIREVFADELISDVGLEEIAFDEFHQTWLVTIGFFPPWQKIAHSSLKETLLGPDFADTESPRQRAMRRAYKIVTISDKTGKVMSVRNRELA